MQICPQRPPVSIVWFKRDLRLSDHTPLAAAAKAGLPVILLYVFEPSLLALPENAVRHGRFIRQSLDDMQRQLSAHGLQLHVFHEEVAEIFARISTHYMIKNLFSHLETGLNATFQRDKAIARFCREQHIVWQEFGQDGVLRARRDRRDWEQAFHIHMLSSQAKGSLPALQPAVLPDAFSTPAVPPEFLEDVPEFQPGGETLAWRYLHSFRQERAVFYSRHISKPGESRRSCSRLSPYLAFGCISARQVWQFVEDHAAQSPYSRQLKNFQSRLRWRSHFIQKLESDFRMEWLDINRGFAGLVRGRDPEVFAAWSEGRTGVPMVDATMRCLRATGYINFRMRAMLATFWSFTLWQDWRIGAQWLAQVFLDFEPGIHYPQWQMQSGTTGYHTLRIYNATTQSERHDPTGAFVRTWVPELAQVPVPQIYEPWKMTALEQTWYQCRIGEDYPSPIVDIDKANRENKEIYWAFRQSEAVQSQLQEVWERMCLAEDAAAYKAGIKLNQS